MAKRVLVFDVNETLLDLAALDEPFVRVFKTDGVRTEWFDQLIRSMLVTTSTTTYVPFAEIARGALATIARRRGVTLTDEDATAILSRVRQLPAHPEVTEALELLRREGFRLATLTNSAGDAAEAQLARAGIRGLFERVLSSDAVRRLKPRPEPYLMAAKEMGVGIGEVRLVAAHDWDVAGALRAGCAAAFVARPGRQLDLTFPQPDISGPDLIAVARAIFAAER